MIFLGNLEYPLPTPEPSLREKHTLPRYQGPDLEHLGCRGKGCHLGPFTSFESSGCGLEESP